MPGEALSTEGKNRASAPASLSLQQKQPAPCFPCKPTNGQAGHRMKHSGNTGDGRKNSVTVVDSAWRRCQRTSKIQLDLAGPRESRGSGSEKAGSSKCVCCVLGILHSFCVGRGEPGKVGWAVVGYLSWYPYQGPNLSSLLPAAHLPCPHVPGLQPVNSLRTSMPGAGGQGKSH